MGNILSYNNSGKSVDAVNVFLCHGNRHDNKVIHVKKYHNTLTIDLNEKVQPDIVGNITTMNVPNNIETLTFAFCPTYLFNDDLLYKWFQKVKIGGTITIFGPSYDSKVNIKEEGQKGALQIVPFKNLLLKQMKKSHTRYAKKLNPTKQPHVILIRKK